MTATKLDVSMLWVYHHSVTWKRIFIVITSITKSLLLYRWNRFYQKYSCICFFIVVGFSPIIGINNIFCFWFQSTRFRISSDCGSLSNWRHCSDLFSVLHKVSISLITISTSTLHKWSYNYQETPGLCEETSFRCWSDCKQPENSLYSIWRSSVQFICFTIRTESE